MGVRVGVEVGMGVGVLSCNPSRTFGHLLAIVDLLCFAPPFSHSTFGRTTPSVALPSVAPTSSRTTFGRTTFGRTTFGRACNCPRTRGA